MTYEELLENYRKERRGVIGRIDTEKKDCKIFHLLIQRIDAGINQETMDRYGIEKQSLVAMEELAELQKAISKLVRNLEERTKPLEFKGLRNNLIEEMADVLICMDQLIEYYQIQGIEIQDTIQAKQKRQAKRLEEE